MCGRFTLDQHGDLVARHFGVPLPSGLRPRFNVAPSQDVLAIRLLEGERRSDWLRWGFTPRDGAAKGIAPINARSETAFDKFPFRGAARHRRCLVPADGFFEWRKLERAPGRPRGAARVPIRFQLEDGGLFAFAGLWTSVPGPEGQPLLSLAILTTTANALVAPVHDRMPVILAPQGYAAWLDASIVERAPLEPLLAPFPAERMRATPVSARVNDVRHDDPECVGPPEPALLELLEAAESAPRARDDEPPARPRRAQLGFDF
jgi:putative SOS response-associated peptidase YedK